MLLLMKKISTLFLILIVFACAEDGANFDGNFSGIGTGGSLASFLVTNNNLYVLSDDELLTYNLNNPSRLTFTSTLKLPSHLETIAPYENYLFLGSSDAVYFLNRSNGDMPSLISVYQHVTACDPVVARNSVAYSTIRSTNCRGIIQGNDLLDAIDISDIANPQVIYSMSVDSPYGLSINDDFLFVCEADGISIFNTDNVDNPILISKTKIGNGTALDIIQSDGFLIVVTTEGIFNVTYDLNGQLQILGQVTSR
jgi:hypothetical protein